MEGGNSLHTGVLLVFLTLSAYLSADTVDTIIGRSLDGAMLAAASTYRDGSALTSKHDLGSYASILDRGLFGEGGKPSGGQSVPALTNVKLVGTVEGEEFAGAVIDDGTGQTFYRRGRALPDGSVLTEISRAKVSLRRQDGTTLSVEMVEDAKIVAMQKTAGSGVKRMSGDRFIVDQREVAASTENLGQILTQARALPYAEGGKTVGFRISEIVPNSIYAKIGLQNGDIIQRVNSQELDNPAKFFQMYQGLRDERSITIDLVRNGQRQTLNYDIR